MTMLSQIATVFAALAVLFGPAVGSGAVSRLRCPARSSERQR